MINQFSSTRLLVVGDVMLDKYYYGRTQRISPEAPVPIVNVDADEYRLGGGANVALNASRLGVKTELMSVIGADEAGNTLKELLKEVSVKCHFECEKNCQTITKIRVISQHQQLLRLDFEHHKPLTPVDIKRYRSALKDVSAVVISDYGKGAVAQAPALIAAARKQNIVVIVDPKGNDFGKYSGATILTPNVKEFEAVVGKCEDEEQFVKKGLALIKKCQLEALLITRSEQGMTLLKKSGEVLNLPAHAQDVYDVTGAGDTVVAVLAAGLGSGLLMDQATKLANIAAGIVVAKVGTASVDVVELAKVLDANGKIFTKAALKKEIKHLQQQGQRVVFTNGCFDLLHVGHIHYLVQAKALGDKLIVAVNSDRSVKKLKGSKRPVNKLSYRMDMLCALSSVDYVVAFNDDTPENLVCSLQPNYLVKAKDYDNKDIAGRECVEQSGGKVVLVDFVKGYSSTKMVDKIQQL